MNYSDTSYSFQPAKTEEFNDIFRLYVERVSWMDKKGLKQWNTTSYLETYPLGYYEKHQSLGELYTLKTDGKLCGAVVLLNEDSRWEDRKDSAACYVHNLVTSTDAKGAGVVMLSEIEQLAAEKGKDFVRLDCAVDNEFLNHFYGSSGYEYAGPVEDPPYYGNRREKKIR